MRIALLAVALGLASPARAQFACGAAAGFGGGFCTPPPSCTPFSYPASPLYQSLTFSDAWTANQSVLTLNQVSSPACTISGANLREDATASAQHRVFNQPTVTLIASAHTVTLFAKQTVGTRNIEIDIDDSGFASGLFSYFNLSTCAPINGSSGVFGAWTLYSASATLVGGWCEMVANFTATVSVNPFIFVYLVSGTSDTYNGDGVSTNSIWGLDLR